MAGGDWFTKEHLTAAWNLLNGYPEMVIPALLGIFGVGYAAARWRYLQRVETLEERVRFREDAIQQLQAQLEAKGMPGLVASTQDIADRRFVELRSASSLQMDLSAGTDFLVTLSHNATMAAPLNPREGAFHLLVRQGSRPCTLSWVSAFKFRDGLEGVPNLSMRPDAVDVLRFDAIKIGQSFTYHVTLLTAPTAKPGAHASAGIAGQGPLATMGLPEAARAIFAEFKRQGLDRAPSP